MNDLAGFPYREIQFTKDGEAFDPGELEAVEAMIADDQITDLMVVSHGWRNDLGDARGLYGDLAASLRAELDALPRPGLGKLGIVGVLWPAKKFTDPDEIVGGGAGIGDEAEGLKAELEGYFAGEEAADELARAKALVDRIEDDDAAAAELAELIRRQATGGAADGDTDSTVDRDFLEMSGGDLLESFSAAGAEPEGDDDFEGGGAAGFFGDAVGNLFGSIFDRTRSVLNYSTYYTMKRRAGKVGENGLHQVLARLAAPGLRLHLVGHSFGGKVVTSAANGTGGATDLEIDSLSLLQAAFSHNGFAENFRGDRDGAYRPVVAGGRLKGPVIVTHTKNDDAVKRPYALASRLAGQDAAGVGGAGDRFGAIGSNGAQSTPEVDPVEAVLRDPGEAYDHLARGKVYNLLADRYIPNHNGVTNRAVANALLEAARQRS